MSASELFFTAFVQTPLTANVPAPIYDATTLTQVVLPAMQVCELVMIWQSSELKFVDEPTFSVGDTGFTVVPTAAGITGSSLNAGGQTYLSMGTTSMPTADTPLSLTSSQDISSGYLNFVIKYVGIPAPAPLMALASRAGADESPASRGRRQPPTEEIAGLSLA